MDPRSALRALTATLDARPDLSEREAQRLGRDLERVELRLRNGDYEKSPFEDNVLNLPDRTHQVMVEVEFMAAVGRSWARLLGPLGLERAGRVIDLGPGWAPKVEMALYYGGFRGHATLVNQDTAAMDTLRRFMTLLKLEFTMETVCEDLFSWRGEPADFVLGNHLLDDLLIDLYCRREGVGAASLYARESAFQRAWGQILAWPPGEARALVERLADAVARLTVPGGHAVFVQYPSYAERTLSLGEAVEWGQRLLRWLGEALVERGFGDLSATAAGALAGVEGPFGPEHCLVLRRLSAAANRGASTARP